MLCRTDLLPRVGIFASDGPPPPLRVSVLAPTAQDSPSAWGNAPGIHATQESPALKARFIPGRPQSIIARAALSRAFSARYADNRIPGTMSRATDETAPLALQGAVFLFTGSLPEPNAAPTMLLYRSRSAQLVQLGFFAPDPYRCDWDQLGR